MRGLLGNIQIDDMRNALDIQTARADIGGNEDMNSPLPKAIHGVFALLLARLPIDACRLDAVIIQLIDRYLDIFGVIEENHALLRLFACENFTEIGEFFSVSGEDIIMMDALGDNAAAFGFQINRICLHHGCGFCLGFAADRGRKQNNLPLLQGCFDDSGNILHVAVIHKAVALIQNDGSDEMCLYFFLTNQIQNTPDRADHDTRLCFQLFQLSADACRTDEKDTACRNARIFLQKLRLMIDLRRQLMGGGEDNRLRAADIHIQLFKNGQKICQGLAGACFGTTDDILAG